MAYLNNIPVNTDIPEYGADDLTQQHWSGLQAVGQLVAAELAQMPRGTLALVEDADCVYWVVALEDQLYLATAPIHEGEIMLQQGALLRALVGVSVEELVYWRSGLEHWLLTQPTLRIAEPRKLQLWTSLPGRYSCDED
ncbi:hypothetical protein [Andreprevotia chitinilytica]|uniref:hypothetical protein n=1 Tax=Andreprevotia chitinilytica TaxID=396808 RepID=UPI0012EC19CF|nr:hypothetical protein [Andreprevotia chitinilytica]